MIKLTKSIMIIFLTILLTNISYAEERDCSKIETNTGSGMLKSWLCKRGSDKVGEDGNFKKGLFNPFKKKS